MTLIPRSGIMEIEPYVPGASKAHGIDHVIKLSSNENPLGPSPHALNAYRSAAEKIHCYPDGGATELRSALAIKHGIDADRIVCGTGSDEIITLLCKAYCGEGDEVLYSEHGFLMYPIAALAAGATPVKAAETNRHTDIEKICSAITSRTRIIFIANPNNPTGATLPARDIENLVKQLPERVLLVLDSAYAEFVTMPDYSDGIDMVDRYANLVMLRTFSKLYGLGGLRIGWSYSSRDIAEVLNRVRGIFNISGPAQAAAIAALGDDDYIEKSLALNIAQRAWITGELMKNGLTVYPSEANFILFSMGSETKARFFLETLKARGILVRGMTAYGLPDCLRVTIGLPEDMRKVVSTIQECLQS